MKITILTDGSRGDIQPFLPLSLRLMGKGHSIKLAAPVRSKNLIKENTTDFVPLAGDPQDLSRLNDAGNNFLKLLRELMNHAVKIGADVWLQTKAERCKSDHSYIHACGQCAYACP